MMLSLFALLLYFRFLCPYPGMFLFFILRHPCSSHLLLAKYVFMYIFYSIPTQDSLSDTIWLQKPL